MKQCAWAIGILFVVLPVRHIFAQGILTPPGAPAPTMKTLDQVKPGVPIDPSKAGFTTPYTINAPGNYYLTGNIAVSTGNAIVIATNNVTLNLGGFTISSTASPIGGNGVLVNDSLRNITILNGHIVGNVTTSNTGSGFMDGINTDGDGPGTSAANVRVTGVSVFGCAGGILAGQGLGSLVESCHVFTIGFSGIIADTIKGSSANNCGGPALSGVDVAESQGGSIGSSSSGNGINATTVQNSTGTSITGSGIQAYTAQNCRGTSINGTGLSVFSSATNCTGIANSGIGIYTGGNGTLSGCQTLGSISAGAYCTLSSCRGATIIAGQGCTLTNCVAQSSSGNGISVGADSTVTHCTSSGNSGIGIVLGDRSVAQNCNVSANSGDGITLTVQGSVLNSNVCANGGDGIHLLGLTNSNNRVDGNNASNNTGIGIHQTGGPDLIVRNLARSNVSGTNYSPSSGSSVGPIGQPNTATSPWANFQ